MSHKFRLTNAGHVPLKVVYTRPECSCEVVGAPDVVAAGASADIEVVLDTRNLVENRPTRASTTIATNDPKRKEIQLVMLVGDVTSEFVLSDEFLEFRSAGTDSKVITVGIINSSRSKLLSVRSSDASVEVKLEATSSSDPAEYRIVAWQKENTPSRPHFGNIIVQTSSAFTPEIRIPVRGSIANRH